MARSRSAGDRHAFPVLGAKPTSRVLGATAAFGPERDIRCARTNAGVYEVAHTRPPCSAIPSIRQRERGPSCICAARARSYSVPSHLATSPAVRDAIRSIKTTRVHHAARRQWVMATCHARQRGNGFQIGFLGTPRFLWSVSRRRA
jgi:hypothetical protein